MENIDVTNDFLRIELKKINISYKHVNQKNLAREGDQIIEEEVNKDFHYNFKNIEVNQLYKNITIENELNHIVRKGINKIKLIPQQKGRQEL